MNVQGAQQAGHLVLVVGPSGAGKDTLIDEAHRLLGADANYVFARRLVTRDASAAEDNLPISRQQFDQGRREGAFALTWEAHGLGYALPSSIDNDLAAGKTVIANVSRRVVLEARRRYGPHGTRVTVVLVTAPVAVLAARLAARGRESAAEIAERLGRDVGAFEADHVIQNTGSVAQGAAELLAILRNTGLSAV